MDLPPKRVFLKSKPATKPGPTWGIGKLIPAPPSKPTSRSYISSMKQGVQEKLEKIHTTRDRIHVLQLRLRSLRETKGEDERKEEEEQLLGEIKTLEEVVQEAVRGITPV
jgi:hypothetical protein